MSENSTVMEPAQEDTFTVILPETDDAVTVDRFLISLINHTDVRGVPTLSKNYSKMLYHQRLVDNFKAIVESNACYINGVRNKNQKKGDSKRSLRSTAKAFYNSLNTPALRMQCQLFQVDFDSYDSIEAVVDMLVTKHIEMMTVS